VTASSRKWRYTFRDALNDFFVLRRSAPAPAGAEVASPLSLRLAFETNVNAAERERFLRDVGLPSLNARAIDLRSRLATLERVDDLLRSSFVLYRVPKRSVVQIVSIVEDDALGPEPEPDAWIEIELVDDAGNAVPNAAYRIESEDGRVRTGTTNSSGKAREEGLHGGSCKVSFPEIHGPDWAKVA
jgi:hypothetical protein